MSGSGGGGREGSGGGKVSQHLRFLREHPSSPINKDDVLQAIQGVESTAKEEGLTNSQLLKIIIIVTSGLHYIGLSRRLIRAMIPKAEVEARVVVRLISRFSSPLVPRSLQPLLLQWVLAVYELLDDRRPLHKLYGVLFYWLDYATLLPHLCHLLYRLTEKKDVQPFRIRRLMRLQQHLGSEPCLTALLSCYKLFQPAMVTLVVRQTARKRWFPPLDKELVADIARVQRRNSTGVEGISTHEHIDMSTLLPRRRRAVPLLKAAMDMHRARNLSAGNDPSRRQTDVGAGETDHLLRRGAAADLAPHIGRLAMPAQVAAVLNTRNLQHVLSVSASPEFIHRLSYWLLAQLTDAEQHLLRYSPFFDQLLTAAADLAVFLQETPPPVHAFLDRALLRWDGVHYRRALLTLITLVPPMPFEELYPSFLQPLSNLAMLGALDLQCELLMCYRALLQTYTRFPWSKHGEEGGATQFKHRYIFHDPPPPGRYTSTVEQLLAFVDVQCELALHRWPGNERVEHYVFAIYESLGFLCRKRGQPLVSIPPQGVVYDVLASSSAFALSRVCGILATTREDYAYHLENVKPHLAEVPAIPHLDLFNCYIIDIINMIWRSTVFGKAKDATILFDDFEEDREHAMSHISSPTERSHVRQRFRKRIESCIHTRLASRASTVHSLSLAYSKWCSGYSHTFLKQQEGAGDTASGTQLKPAAAQKNKRQLWMFLRDTCALDGLGRFLLSSITTLQTSK